MEDEYVEIEVDEVVRDTGQAILIRIDKEEIWIPTSQCEDWPDVGDPGTVIMKEWIAIEKDLI